jgi:hypothetical protein
MGVNAQIEVPAFTAGQVLTAAEMTQINTGVPVFATTVTRDAAFGGAGEKVLAEGQFAYIEATDTTQYYNGSAWTTLGASGLSLIAKTSFTTTATWTLDNIFTTTYDNYRIDIVWTQLTSTANYAGFQMRVGGVAATAANYQYAMSEANNAGVTSRYSLSSTYMPVLDSTSADIAYSGSSFTVFKPFTAQATSFVGQFIGVNTGLRGTAAQGFHSLATSYDGIQIANGSTASGTVYVYGLAK